MTEEWDANDTITPEEEVLAVALIRHSFNFKRQFEVRRPLELHQDLDKQRSYWLDFAWPEKKFAIEIDGHPINLEREVFLMREGWRVLHLQNEHFRTRKTLKYTFEFLLEYLCHTLKALPTVTS